MSKPPTEFEEFDLYKGKCKVRFYPNSHRYTVNGKPTGGSVTSIISVFDKSGALVNWATELYREFLLGIGVGNITEEHIYEGCELHAVKKKEAADFGSKIHEFIEKYLKNENPEMPEDKEVQIGVNAFLDWIKDNKVVFKSSERAVYSRKYDFIGKMDAEAKVNGKLCLLDFKSSNGLYNTMNMQTAAYVMADQEESDRKYHGRWLIRLAKETEKEYNARMEKKNLIRQRKGKEPIDFPPYQVFETKFLDDTAGNLERDYEAFLACKKLKDFDNATGFYASLK